MEDALRFLRAYEVWVYLLLGFGGIIYVRKFILAWRELRGAGFGLERDSAQSRLNQAASIIVLVLTLALMEFVMVSFVAPTVPGAVPLLTPTLDLLASPSITMPASTPEIEATSSAIGVTNTPIPTSSDNGCIPGQIEITSPANGEDISGARDIVGSADIPNFGFYKLEMKRPEEGNWLTILAGNEKKNADVLGIWNTSLLPPGYHQLSLVVTDNLGISLPRCTIQVRVIEETT